MADIYLKDRGGTPIRRTDVQKIKVPKDSAAESFEEFCLTTDATATANDIATGKTAYVNGVRLTGTKAEPSGKITITDMQETDVTDYATAQVVDENLVAGNIKSGVDILGVTGTLSGDSKPDYLIQIGCIISTIYLNTRFNMTTLQASLATLDYGSNNECVLFQAGNQSHYFKVFAYRNQVITDQYGIKIENESSTRDILKTEYPPSVPTPTPVWQVDNISVYASGSDTVTYVNDSFAYLDFVFAASHLAFGYWNDSVMQPIKEVTYTANQQYTVTPDANYDAIEQVTVDVNVPTANYLVKVGVAPGAIYFNTSLQANTMTSFFESFTYPASGIVEILTAQQQYSLRIVSSNNDYMLYGYNTAASERVTPIYSTSAKTWSLPNEQPVTAKLGWNEYGYGFGNYRITSIHETFMSDIRSMTASDMIAFGDWQRTASGHIFIESKNTTYNVKNYASASIRSSALTAGNIKKGVDILGITGTWTGYDQYYRIREGTVITTLYLNSQYSSLYSVLHGLTYDTNNECLLISSEWRAITTGSTVQECFNVVAKNNSGAYEVWLRVIQKDGNVTTTVFNEIICSVLGGFVQPYEFSVVNQRASASVNYIDSTFIAYIDGIFAKSNAAFGKHYSNLQTKSTTITQNGSTSISADSGYDGLQSVDVTVAVPQPSGAINITENGIYDVSDKASAVVNVASAPTSQALNVTETGTFLPSDYGVDYFSSVTVSGLGAYTMITLDAVSAVFTHPLINSTYMPQALFMANDGVGTFAVSTSGLYVDGSAFGMGTGILNCIGFSWDGDCTALYSANFKQPDSSELIANATIVYDTTAHTITVTHFESGGIDLTQYVPMVSMKMWVIVPANLL